MVSEIQPGQTISDLPPAHLDTMGENNTPTALYSLYKMSSELLSVLKLV